MKKQITSKAILFDFGRALLDIEFGIIATLGLLFTRPERVFADYFADRRYFHPLKYLAVVLILYSWAGLDNKLSVSDEGGHKTALPQIAHYFPYVWTIISAAMATLFYKRDGLIFGEHLVIHCYLFAQATLIYLLLELLPFQFLSFVSIPFLLLSSIIFYVWGYTRYIKKPFTYHLFKILGTWLLSAIILFGIGMLIMIVYVGFFKHEHTGKIEFN